MLGFGLVWACLVLVHNNTFQTNTFPCSVQLQDRCLCVLDLSRDICNHRWVHLNRLLCSTTVIPRMEASSWSLGKTGFRQLPGKLHFSAHFMKLVMQRVPSFQSNRDRLFSSLTLWLKEFYKVNSPVLGVGCAACLEGLFMLACMSAY